MFSPRKTTQCEWTFESVVKSCEISGVCGKSM